MPVSSMPGEESKPETAEALILFAHGARDPAWETPVRRVFAAIQALDPEMQVEIAFLDFAAPSLHDCAIQLVKKGFRRIVVLPMFIAQGGHLKRDVPEILAYLRVLYPDVEFELAGAIGEMEAVVQAVAAAALALVRR